MWRLEKDPHLSSTFAAVTILDRPPDVDRLLARMERAVQVVERLGQRVQPAPVNLTAPTWVTDSNFDLRYHVRHIALPKPGTMRQLLDLATPDHLRSLRPHPSPVAVRRRRRPAGRQVGAGREAASHDHRWRRHGPAVAAVPRFRTRRARTTTARSGTTRRPRPRSRRVEQRPLPRHARRRPAAAVQPAPSDQRTAPRSDRHPRGRVSRRRHGARRDEPAQRHRASQVSTVDQPIVEATDGSAAHPLRRHAGRGEAPGWHAQHRLPHSSGRGRRPLSRAHGVTGGGAARQHGDQHPQRELRGERLLAGADAGADRRHADRRALHLDPGGSRTLPAKRTRRPRSRRWRLWHRRCRRR